MCVSARVYVTFPSKPSSGQLAWCLDKLLTDYILKHGCKVEGMSYTIIIQGIHVVHFFSSGLFYQPDSSTTHHTILSNKYQTKFWEVYQIIGNKQMVSMRDFLLMTMVVIMLL